MTSVHPMGSPSGSPHSSTVPGRCCTCLSGHRDWHRLAQSLWTLQQELLPLGQESKSCEGRSSAPLPADEMLQESLNWTKTLFPLVQRQHQQPDHALALEPCSSWHWRGHGLSCHDTGISWGPGVVFKQVVTEARSRKGEREPQGQAAFVYPGDGAHCSETKGQPLLPWEMVFEAASRPAGARWSGPGACHVKLFAW